MSRRLFLLLLYIVVASALLFVRLPISPTYFGRTVEDAGHTPLFMIGTLFILRILRHDFRIDGPRLFALAGLIGVAAGFMSEVIQKPLRRDPSWDDVLADAVGVLLALALYALFSRSARVRGAPRATALLIIAGCVVSYLAPVVNMTRAYMHRNGQFPVLADFHSPIELYWMVGYGINRELRDGALEVEFEAPIFPGFTFHEPMPDWRAFKTLIIEAENPDGQVLYLGLRIHDIGHGREFADRFNRMVELAPGERRVLEIPLDDVQHGPRNRLMNMAQISDVTLFRGRKSGSHHLRLHSMRLQ